MEWTRPKTFLCYIEGSDDRWQGVCVDFDLSAVGRSVDDVKVQLYWAVHTYIEDALREAEPSRTRLLTRRSPWFTRLSWRFHVAASRLGRFMGWETQTKQLPLPCPA